MSAETEQEDQAARDVAASVFSSLNLLTIKKSVRILCELDVHVLEDFVKKFSGVIIFLLNILDPERAGQLLDRLTDSSVIYLTEEELRLHLIRQVAFVEDPEMIMQLSPFMDTLDRPYPEHIFENCGPVLEYLYHSEHTLKKSHFAYLDTLLGERTSSIIKEMLMRNVHVALGVLIFSSRPVSFEVMDELVKFHPETLPNLPIDLYRARFMKPHDYYLEHDIFYQLPNVIQKEVLMIQSIQEQYREELEQVHALSGTPEAAQRNRQEIINIVYGILKRINPTLKTPLLFELQQRGSLTREDIVLLNEFDRG